MRRNLGFCLLATIRMIATSNPKQVQIRPPREPVKSSAKKQVSAAPDRARKLNARCSFARFSSNNRSDENPDDCLQRGKGRPEPQDRTGTNESRGGVVVDEGRGQTSAVSELWGPQHHIRGEYQRGQAVDRIKQNRVLREPNEAVAVRRDVPMKKPLMTEVANSRKCPTASGGISARLEIRGNASRPRRSFACRQLGSLSWSTT